MKLRTHCGFCLTKSLRIKYTFDDYSIVECKKCRHIFRNKILSRNEEHVLYDKDYYLNLQKEYFSYCLVPNPRDKSRINDFNSRIYLLDRFVSKKKDVRLLDIGSGTGAFGYLAQKHGWDTLNLEISSYATKIAKDKFKVKVYCGEVNDKGFKSKNFDMITMWESIANIEDTLRLLKVVGKLLNNKGKIAILTTVVDSWLYDIAKAIYWLSFGKVKYFVKEGYPIHHANHFSRSNLKATLKRGGFKVILVKNREIPYKYTKLPKIFLPILIILGQFAKFFDRTIQVLVVAEKQS